MIVCFPEIYPDELVYSWFCRYYVYAGCFASSDALRELLNSRSNNPSKEFIGQLSQSAKEFIETMYSMDDLILNHTMFPQYARFLPAKQKKKAILRMKNDHCDAHHLFTILPRVEGEQYMKYCPMCAEEDRRQYGETYWHRRHQIRNVHVCVKHNCLLKNSRIPAKSEHSFSLFPAETMIGNETATVVDKNQLFGFSEYLEKVFYEPMNFDDDTPISSILYYGLIRTEYMKVSGRSRYTKKLSDDLCSFYSNMGVLDIASMYQIQKTLLSDSNAFSVVCQIAFFIGLPIKELLHPNLTPDQIRQEQCSHYMKCSSPVNWEHLDNEIASALEEFCLRTRRQSSECAERPERIGERLVYREMGLLGHQLENLPKSKNVFLRYTESYPEMWARRVIWAYMKLKKENPNVEIYWSDLRTISGVKKKNFHLVIPYLTKHTSEETARKITQIVMDQ